MTEAEDLRKGLPSASKLDLLVRCPGSWLATRGLPPLPQSEDAREGSEVHSAFAGDTSMADLDSEAKRKVVSDAMKIRDRLVEEFSVGSDADYRAVETRFWLHDKDGKPVFSAQLDYGVWFSTSKVLVLDFKSLYADYVAVQSWQLLGQSCAFVQDLHRRGYEVKEVFAGFIQPRVTHKPTLVHYTEEQIWSSVRNILRYLDAANFPDAPRHPGQHCRNCEARGVCAEAQSLSALLVHEYYTAVGQLGPEQLAAILPKLRAIEDICSQVRARAKQLALLAPGSVPGYEIKEVDSPLLITDAQGCYTAIKEYVEKDAFRALLKLPVAELREVFVDRFKRANNCTGKKAAEVFEQLIAPHSMRGPKQQRLVKEKGTTDEQ